MSKKQPSISLLKMQSETKSYQKSENYTCKHCNAEFEKPIFAVIASNPIAEGYYACPKCLTKMTSAENQTGEQTKPQENFQEELSSTAKEETEAPATCTHFVGYLSKRSKNMSVPEDCFTCSLMIDCMSH